MIVIMGLVAGIASGLLGVGGGLLMVPALTLGAGFGQHRAHATSLAAIIPIAIVGAGRYAVAESVDLGVAALLAAGAVVGAPLGARLMARIPERTLRGIFGVFLTAVAVQMLWP